MLMRQEATFPINSKKFFKNDISLLTVYYFNSLFLLMIEISSQ